MVIPENAHSQTIKWSVKDTGTTDAKLFQIDAGYLLLANRAGTVIITATIRYGECEKDFVKDFEIIVKTPPDPTPKFILYPNPTSGHFVIKNENMEFEIVIIHIHDATGRLIRSVLPQYESSESKEFTLMDISDLSAGVYFLNIVTDKGIIKVHKVVRG